QPRRLPWSGSAAPCRPGQVTYRLPASCARVPAIVREAVSATGTGIGYRGPGEFGRADLPGRFTQLGGPDAGQRAVPGAGDRASVFLARVVQEQRRRTAHPARDDDQIGIEDVAHE